MSRRWSFIPGTVLIATLLGCAGSGGWGGLPVYEGPPVEGTIPRATGAQVYAVEQVTLANLEIDRAGAAGSRGDEKTARVHLDRAEQILTGVLATDPHSRDAAVALGAAYLYRGSYGDPRGTQRCIEFLTRVLEADPYAVQAARYLTHAYHQIGDGVSAVYYANYVETVSRDRALVKEVGAIRSHYQAEFLAGWNRHIDFYESPDARVERYNPTTFQKEVVLQITPQVEGELAGRSVQQLSQSMTLAQDEETRAYLQKLVAKLVARTPGPPFTYRVELVTADEPNAMALPGKIFVNTGLILFAETEAELVAVLAHELGHIYAHHSARAWVVDTKNRSIKESLLSALRQEADFQSQLLDLGTEVGLELIRRGYNRGQEKEADRYGTHIAFNAGYNPTYLTGIFLRMYEQNPNHPWKLLATHPPTSERIEYTTEYLMNFPLEKEMQIDTKRFQEIKTRLAGGAGGARP